jgi:hypothetical protein
VSLKSEHLLGFKVDPSKSLLHLPHIFLPFAEEGQGRATVSDAVISNPTPAPPSLAERASGAFTALRQLFSSRTPVDSDSSTSASIGGGPAMIPVISEQAQCGSGDAANSSTSHEDITPDLEQPHLSSRTGSSSSGRSKPPGQPVCLICLDTLTSEDFQTGEWAGLSMHTVAPMHCSHALSGSPRVEPQLVSQHLGQLSHDRPSSASLALAAQAVQCPSTATAGGSLRCGTVSAQSSGHK